MTSKAIEAEILKNLSQLELENQNKVLRFIKSLLGISKPDNTRLLTFAGTIEKGDLALMEKAIEEGCEKIDQNEW